MHLSAGSGLALWLALYRDELPRCASSVNRSRLRGLCKRAGHFGEKAAAPLLPVDMNVLRRLGVGTVRTLAACHKPCASVVTSSGGDPARKLDLNFRDLLSDVLFKRDWFRDFIQDHAGRELEFVGKYTVNDAVETVAADMRKSLYGEEGPPQSGNWEEHLRMLIDKAEAAGIWVMRNGIVGSNTHRPLSVSQFRGFAISDKVVPLIFINGKDAKAAQIFTFAHELAHIWLGESGVSNVELGDANHGAYQKVERKCNKIAAEFLIPAAGFPAQWRAADSLSDNADRLSRIYKVSRIVIVRRALDLGLIDQASYSRFYATEVARWSDTPASEGGSFHNNLPLCNGLRFTRAVVNQAVGGGLLLRHAASLLNAQPTAILSYHKNGRPAQ
ncbi:ImmA/IrrE family metallo-endopeptidase [Sinorhizobium meliloti]|nr:ImmA/IrrE family metallo-endopeptidase [Sinorhizobium meliloti]